MAKQRIRIRMRMLSLIIFSILVFFSCSLSLSSASNSMNRVVERRKQIPLTLCKQHSFSVHILFSKFKFIFIYFCILLLLILISYKSGAIFWLGSLLSRVSFTRLALMGQLCRVSFISPFVLYAATLTL